MGSQRVRHDLATEQQHVSRSCFPRLPPSPTNIPPPQGDRSTLPLRMQTPPAGNSSRLLTSSCYVQLSFPLLCLLALTVGMIILNEISQKEIGKYPHGITYMWNIKCNMNELIYETERDSQTKRVGLWLPKGNDGLGGWD